MPPSKHSFAFVSFPGRKSSVGFWTYRLYLFKYAQLPEPLKSPPPPSATAVPPSLTPTFSSHFPFYEELSPEVFAWLKSSILGEYFQILLTLPSHFVFWIHCISTLRTDSCAYSFSFMLNGSCSSPGIYGLSFLNKPGISSTSLHCSLTLTLSLVTQDRRQGRSQGENCCLDGERPLHCCGQEGSAGSSSGQPPCRLRGF